MIRVVELAQAEDGLGGREQVARVLADGGPAVGQVTHFASHPAFDPGLVAGKVGAGEGGGNAGEFESSLAGDRFDLLGGNGHSTKHSLSPRFTYISPATSARR